MDAVSTRVLTLNGGSSSVKYGVYAVGEAVVAATVGDAVGAATGDAVGESVGGSVGEMKRLWTSFEPHQVSFWVARAAQPAVLLKPLFVPHTSSSHVPGGSAPAPWLLSWHCVPLVHGQPVG